MRGLRKKVSILIFSVVFLGLLTSGKVYGVDESKAQVLKDMDLFNGTNQGFELERAANRTEASVMLVRLLGKEKEAIEKSYSHPFTDVPNWASSYIGYMYESNLTKGISESTFGANDLISYNQYLTFVLRSLGYDDSKGDFEYNHAIQMAHDVSLISDSEMLQLQNENFTREGVVWISYNALKVTIKDSNDTLIEKLIVENVVDQQVAINHGIINDNQENRQEVNDEILEAYDGFYKVEQLEDLVDADGNVIQYFDDISNARVINHVHEEDGFSEKRVHIYVDRSQLDQSLKNFKYFDHTGFSDGDIMNKVEFQKFIEVFVVFSPDGKHYHEYDDSEGASNGYNEDVPEVSVVMIYDENKKMIGYTVVTCK
jgi:hypothetical protein